MAFVVDNTAARCRLCREAMRAEQKSISTTKPQARAPRAGGNWSTTLEPPPRVTPKIQIPHHLVITTDAKQKTPALGPLAPCRLPLPPRLLLR